MASTWLLKYYTIWAAFYYLAWYLAMIQKIEVPPQLIPINSWLFGTVVLITLAVNAVQWYLNITGRSKEFKKKE